MKIRRNRTVPLDVVASVEQQTAEAEALARIAGQARLMNPRLNPATRKHADQLLTGQLVRRLNAENSRLERRIRVQDGRAEDAERTLEAIQLARQASSPARSVLALHTSKRMYMRLALGASLVLAAGSSMGVEATAHVLKAHAGTGYIAEIGLTGLATAAITYRAHLAEHRGTLAKNSWQSYALWALMVVPLLVSVGCNLGTLNVIGAFCAIGAAAFSLLGCVVADRSAEAMQGRAAEVSGQDEAELRSVAMGEDLFTAISDQEPELTDAERDAEALEEEFATGRFEAEEVDAEESAVSGGRNELDDEQRSELETLEAQRGLVELEDWLSREGPDEPGDGGVRPAPSPTGPEDGPRGAAADPAGHIDAAGDRVDSGPPGDDGAARVLPAAQARRAVGASTRARIAEYLAEHPTATRRQVAQALGLSEATVKRYRRSLRTSGGGSS